MLWINRSTKYPFASGESISRHSAFHFRSWARGLIKATLGFVLPASAKRASSRMKPVPGETPSWNRTSESRANGDGGMILLQRGRRARGRMKIARCACGDSRSAPSGLTIRCNGLAEARIAASTRSHVNPRVEACILHSTHRCLRNCLMDFYDRQCSRRYAATSTSVAYERKGFVSGNNVCKGS